ncbi:MAG: NADH-quinone oxidoreductase subunit A [Chthoniobacteraceae bacterium]
MISDYLPVLLQVLVAVIFAVSALVISVLMGKTGRRNPTKDSAYECGMLPEGPAQARFSVKFYLVAMLFILFDIEIVFMYAWASVYREFLALHGTMIFWSMLGFVGIITVGYVYAVLKGALDWKRN